LTGSQTATYRDLIDRMMEGDGVWEVSVDDASLLLSTPFRSVAELKNDIETLIETGAIVSRGKTLRNARAQKEAKRRNDTSEKRKAAADSRWKKGQSNSDANAMQMHESCNAPPQSIVHSPQSIDPQSTVQKPEAKAIETNTTIMAATATNQPSPSQKKKAEQDETVQIVFELWQKIWNHHQAKLLPVRRKIILDRLKDGYTREELCRVIVGWWFTDWRIDGKLVRQNGGNSVNGIDILLRINSNGDNMTDGLELYDSNARDASKMLPLEMAVRHCKTYDQLLRSKLLYRAVDITPEEASAMWTALRYQGGPEQPLWTRWAYAVLCEWCPGGDAEKLAAMGRGWVAWEEAPAADGSRLSDVDREWIINLGVVEGEG